MSHDLMIFDDVVGREPSPDVMRRMTDWLATLNIAEPDYTRGGEYRNVFGERVTWKSTEDGKNVLVQTWPTETRAEDGVNGTSVDGASPKREYES
jgi:hypothetical protein